MSNPKRVLMVIGKMDRAGAETIVMNIYRNIDREKVQFDFAVHSNEKADYDDEILALGGRIFRFPQYKIYNSISYKKKWHEFFKEHANEFCAVHGHIGSCASLYLHEAKKYNIYTIAHSHNFLRGLNGLMFKILCYPQRFIADQFFGCSIEAGIDRFGKKVVNNPKIYKTINNGIDAKQYIYNLETRNKYRDMYNVKDKLVVGHVGRFVHQKNHKFLIDIFYEIKKIRPNAILALAGRGELEEEIKQSLKELNLLDDVIFGGVRDDIADYMQMFDVFVFPSHYEGLGIVAVEAQATGLPSVLSNTIPPLVKVTDNCIFLSLNSPASKWAEETIKLYDNTNRVNTYDNIVNNDFDIITVTKELEKYYLSIKK